MDVSQLAHPGTQATASAQPPPRVVADLRPAADAAALMQDARPAGALSSVLPAPLAQVAEVSRSLLATAGEEGPTAVARAERVLKPWNIPMLPASLDDAPRSTPDQDAATGDDIGAEGLDDPGEIGQH